MLFRSPDCGDVRVITEESQLPPERAAYLQGVWEGWKRGFSSATLSGTTASQWYGVHEELKEHVRDLMSQTALVDGRGNLSDPVRQILDGHR